MYERLTLVLDPIEMAALKQAARQELRKPRDQVRHILRATLLTESHDPPTMNEGCTAIDRSTGATPHVKS